jgi:hypothetical protein
VERASWWKIDDRTIWFSALVLRRCEKENLSAVLEPGALIGVLRKLSAMKEEARGAYDDADAFSRLMSVLVKSAAGIEYDSESMCSEEGIILTGCDSI